MVIPFTRNAHFDRLLLIMAWRRVSVPEMAWRIPWMTLASSSSSWISCPPSAAASTRRRALCWCSSLTSRRSRIRSYCSRVTPARWTLQCRKVRAVQGLLHLGSVSMCITKFAVTLGGSYCSRSNTVLFLSVLRCFQLCTVLCKMTYTACGIESKLQTFACLMAQYFKLWFRSLVFLFSWCMPFLGSTIPLNIPKLTAASLM